MCVKSLFGFEENYYKPIKTNEALDDYFLEIQSSGDKDNSLTLAENLDEFWALFFYNNFFNFIFMKYKR